MQLSFDWTRGYPSVRLPVFGRNVVSTSHPLAAQAGLRMLLAGGNAVDAAIAAAAVMTIVEPVSNGLGSDAFCILWDGKRVARPERLGTRAGGLDARATSGASTAPMRRRRPGAAGTRSPCPAPWPAGSRLSERFGRLPFADLLQPAIEIAERGYAVPVVVQQKWAAAAALLAGEPGFAEAFMPRGRAPEVGELFRFEAAARTLRLIADSRGEAFYRGEIAEAAARHAREPRRRDDGRRLRRLRARMGHAAGEGLPRPHAARDPAQRPGHRGADRARHPAALRPRRAAGRRRRPRSTCRSRR